MNLKESSPRPRRKQEHRRAETRAKLLAAAGRVFAARGFHGATLDEIAEAAGVSKGSVYYNFASKDDLFVTLLEELHRAQVESMRETLAAGSEEAARSVGGGFLRHLQRDPRWAPLFFEFVAYAARNPAVGERFAEWAREARQAAAELIEARAAQLGVAPALPADELALALNALGNGLLIEAMFDPSDAPRAFDDVIATLLGPPAPE